MSLEDAALPVGAAAADTHAFPHKGAANLASLYTDATVVRKAGRLQVDRPSFAQCTAERHLSRLDQTSPMTYMKR
jgi:hypothetical protein